MTYIVSSGALNSTHSLTARVKVRERGPGLLRPRLNTGPICDDSAAEDKCGAVGLQVNQSIKLFYSAPKC